MAGSDTQILTGFFDGKLPIVGKKDWMLYYVELTNRQMHIYDGNTDPTRSRKHLHTLELHCTDTAGNEGRDRKNEYKFYYDRGIGGRYVFKCPKQQERQSWVMQLQRIIQKQEYLEQGIQIEDLTASLPVSPTLKQVDAPKVPSHRTSTFSSGYRNSTLDTPPTPPPHKSSPNPFHKRDSGFVSGSGVVSQGYRSGGSSGEGEIVHDRIGSGDTTIVHSAAVVNSRSKSSSADGKITHKKVAKPNKTKPSEDDDDDDDLSMFDWYWGQMSRDECGKELMDRGKIGNFVVRKNDRGDYVMSFWRKDGIHHHRIQKNGDRYRFEKSVVQADGMSIPDLLDTYMKHCTDKSIGPFGGELYLIYTDAWNPPVIDFNKFEEFMSSGEGRKFKPGTEMSGNTYGGLTLHQIKEREVPVKKTNGGGIPTPFAGLVPPPGNSTTTSVQGRPLPSSPNKKAAKPTPKPAPKPVPKNNKPQSPNQLSQQLKNRKIPPGPGYVNLFPPPSPQVAPSSNRQSYNVSDEEDEEQEVYIAPGEIETPEVTEAPIYENHGFQNNDSDLYVNYPLAPTTDKVYQNVTIEGKPYTPPRHVKPVSPSCSPQVKKTAPHVRPRKK